MRGAGRTSVFKGAILTVSMRWTDRLIGFVSTLILARLLAPADFGVVAMASLVVGLVDVLLSLGVNVALIRNHNATPAHYNTAWTLRLGQSAIAATVVFVAAPAAALYFSDPRIIPVLRFMALSMLLVGMENIGIITFQKEMRFGLDFRFVFLKRIVGFLATILAAWLLRSYWALVMGTLAGRSFGVLLSYRMHPMRPRFSLEKLREIFSVSQWMLVNSIASYVNRNLDKILIGRRANATIVGGYTLADEISAMPSTEVLAPLNRVLFPAFVAAKNDLAELKRLYLLAQGVQSLLGISAGVGLALVAREAVLVLLGPKWLFVAPFVQMLALANVLESITTSGRYVLLTMGKIRSAALVNWLQVLLFATGALLVLPHGSALQLAALRVATVAAEFLASIWLLRRVLSNVDVMDIVRTVLRPLLATTVMAFAVHSIGKTLQFPPLGMLIAKMGIGMLTFPGALFLMWLAAGKPSGSESYLLDKALFFFLRSKA